MTPDSCMCPECQSGPWSRENLRKIREELQGKERGAREELKAKIKKGTP